MSVNSISAYRARFDFMVLKPAWAFLLFRAIVSLYHSSWFAGITLALMAFSVGMVGAGLHRSLSFKELAAGNPKLADAYALENSEEPDFLDSRAVTKACLGLSFIIGLGAVVFAFRSHGWLFCALLGLGIWWLAGMLFMIAFGLIERQFRLGRLRSVLLGMAIFWTSIGIVVVPIIMGVRALLT